MKKLNYHELREMWLNFYRERGHAVVPSASVVPENDGSVLFTNAGMHPLVPFLMGEKHPAGKRLVNIQKCVRTGDIDCVGDIGHLTFFEMMGNWSLGDYFKKEKVAWSFEFLTDPKYLAVSKDRISVTCFAGDEVAPKDTECAKYWEAVGIPKERIFFLPKKDNWWQLPSGTGPCGPDSEMFMDTGKPKCGANCNPSCDCGKYLEVGNDVYMQYVIKSPGAPAVLAKQKNVDTGMGLERMLLMCNNYKNVFETEIFAPAMEIIQASSAYKEKSEEYVRAQRIVAEHTRAALFIIGDGVIPSNTGAGYVLRRLIRRAARMANKLQCKYDVFARVMDSYITLMGRYYLNIVEDRDKIVKTFMDEIEKFGKTLEQGIKEFEKVKAFARDGKLSGKTAFRLYDTYGFPIELTQELCREQGLDIDMSEYEAAKSKHAEVSGTGAAGVFKGGLADTSGATANLHTATHLLLAVLRQLYGAQVNQKGSNITPERLRFDFNIDHKLESGELAEIEKRINDIISKKLPVIMEEMPIGNARELGATGIFGDKYGDRVKVYTVALPKNGGTVSCEICGGPHATNTGELGTFKIIKEEAVSAGIRRIKAVLQSK